MLRHNRIEQNRNMMTLSDESKSIRYRLLSTPVLQGNLQPCLVSLRVDLTRRIPDLHLPHDRSRSRKLAQLGDLIRCKTFVKDLATRYLSRKEVLERALLMRAMLVRRHISIPSS